MKAQCPRECEPDDGRVSEQLVAGREPLGRQSDPLVGDGEDEPVLGRGAATRRPRRPAARTRSRSRAARRGGARGRRPRVPRPRAPGRHRAARRAGSPRSRPPRRARRRRARSAAATDVAARHRTSTRRLSAFRRIRVAMWSSLNNASRALGSCSLRSSSSSSSSWRSSRLWLRRARFTNRSPMPLRSRRDCSTATWVVTASTSLNARASSPISSSELDLDDDRLDQAHVAAGAQRLHKLRQTPARHVARGRGQLAHRTHDGTCDEPDE